MYILNLLLSRSCLEIAGYYFKLVRLWTPSYDAHDGNVMLMKVTNSLQQK